MRNRLAGNIILICDIVALMLGLFLSRILSEYITKEILGNSYISPTYQEISQRLFIYGFGAAIALFVFYNRGHYRRPFPWWGQVKYILLTITCIAVIDGFTYFSFKYQFSRLWILLSWVVSFNLLVLGRYLAKTLCCYIKIWTIPTVIIGSLDSTVGTLFAINSDPYAGYDIKKIIITSDGKKFNKNLLPKQYSNIEVFITKFDLDQFVQKYSHYFYIIAPEYRHNSSIKMLLKKLIRRGIPYALVPPIEEGPNYHSTPQYFFGFHTMFIIARDSIHSPFGVMVKRFFDIILSILLLLLISPLLIIIALLVKQDGGPILFFHTRIGQHNVPFKCLKFRSMAIDAEAKLAELLASDPKIKKEWDLQHKLLKDPRITKIGLFLRRSSLDELPQLFNVIKGDMSLVGPRPIVIEEIKHYGDHIHDYLSVRPGVTGLWQVSGRSDTTYKSRVAFDSWYVNNWSLWCDIVILIKTAMILVKGKGAY